MKYSKKYFSLLVLIFFSVFKLQSQNDSKCYKFNLADSILLHQHTQSIINLVIEDSLFAEIRFVRDNYDAIVKFIDGPKIRTIYKKKLFGKKIIKVDTIKENTFNPFEKDDFDFVLKQSKDTLNILNHYSIPNKIVIDENNKSKPILLIDKPIFSKDFKMAYIQVFIDYGAGCSGFAIIFLFENGRWRKLEYRNNIRC